MVLSAEPLPLTCHYRCATQTPVILLQALKMDF
jgi:hypothetical protein